MLNFRLDNFIATHVTRRAQSLFAFDVETNRVALQAGIEGKSALVIGGAGTIGAAFIKSLLPFRPAKLFVVDINENGLTELVRDLRSEAGNVVPADFKTYPLNFGDLAFEKIFRKEGPFHIVANFAAHKHVRSEKDPYSIEAMLDNNVLKAKRLLDLLAERPPERFFCVSTDKAANPVNVMGASKKLMERVILAYSTTLPVTTARFANVAFSNGSLLAGFLERLSKRQPLSAPLDVRRYFVSPEEAGQICLLACMLGKPGDIFFPILDLEQDAKSFSEIGESLLRSLGCEPLPYSSEESARQAAARMNGNARYPVYFFNSDTTGEKPVEEFFTEDETPDWSRFRSLGVINPATTSLTSVETMVVELEELFRREVLAKEEIVQWLSTQVPTFEHSETGKNLDQKM